MSGETGMQAASPRPNVAAEDVPEHPDDSDTETIVNQGPTVEEQAEVDLEVSQVENENEKTIQESTKLIEDEEMPSYTSYSELEEKEPVNMISHEQIDKSDKHSVHSCDTEIDSEDSSIESNRYYSEKMRKNCNYDDDSEAYSDEDDEKLYDDEDELEEDEDKDEVKHEHECADDDVQLVEDLSGDEDLESPVDGERASSDDYERRQNNVTKTEIEGKKSHSYQDLSDPKLLSEPKKESSPRKRVDANQVINPLKSASKSSFKPGPKSYKQVQSKVKRYIDNIKSISADERRKSEERKLKESQQNENQVLGQQQQSVQKSTAKMDAQDKQSRFVQALQSEYIKANSEHDQRFTDVRPLSIEKEVVHNAEIKVPILNDLNSGITIKPVWPAAPLVNRGEVEIILGKPDKEEKKVSGGPKAVNGAAEQQDRMDYEDYMKPQDVNNQLIHELAQERSKNAALRKQLEALRWREHESKKIMRDMAVQTEVLRTSDTATSISDWSEYPSVSVPSLDNSTQTSNSLSNKLSNTFLTSSRILETFTAISRQLKNDDSTATFTPNPRKRKLEGKEEKEDEDMKCLVFKENENSAERSFLIAVQDRSSDGDKSDTQINRKCGPYLIGNLEIMMSELNGTINVWGKEISETSQNSANTTTASNVTLENTERRTLKARRTLNPRLVCSTEKKKPPYEHNRPGYRNSYACHSRQLECASPPRYHSHYNRCSCHSCRSSCHSYMHERHHCRHEHSRVPEDEPEHDYYDHGQELEMNRERDYCCHNEERATGGASSTWNRMADTTLYNGKVDSGVHSDTLSNQDEEPDYLQNLGFREMNKIKKRRPAAKSFIDLLKSCGSDIRQTWSNRRNIPGHMQTSTSASEFVQDTNRSVYMPNEQDRRFKSDKNRARPSAETKTAKNLYPEPQGN